MTILVVIILYIMTPNNSKKYLAEPKKNVSKSPKSPNSLIPCPINKNEYKCTYSGTGTPKKCDTNPYTGEITYCNPEKCIVNKDKQQCLPEILDDCVDFEPDPKDINTTCLPIPLCIKTDKNSKKLYCYKNQNKKKCIYNYDDENYFGYCHTLESIKDNEILDDKPTKKLIDFEKNIIGTTGEIVA